MKRLTLFVQESIVKVTFYSVNAQLCFQARSKFNETSLMQVIMLHRKVRKIINHINIKIEASSKKD